MDIFDASPILSDNENATSSSIWFKRIAAQYSVDEDTLMPELCLLAMTELFQRVLLLIKKARQLNVAITIDAEEADRLELSLRLFAKLYQHPDVQGWGLFGLVVQAYSKRALPVLGYLNSLAREQGDTIPVRLVKGAYWDTEIKHAQLLGLADYPVFTRKEASYRTLHPT